MDDKSNSLDRLRNFISDGFWFFFSILFEIASENSFNDRSTQALAKENSRRLELEPQAFETILKVPFVEHLLTKAGKEQADFIDRRMAIISPNKKIAQVACSINHKSLTLTFLSFFSTILSEFYLNLKKWNDLIKSNMDFHCNLMKIWKI